MTAPKGIPKLTRKKGLYLKDVQGKGRGVFCTTPIKKGEILEVTPAVILNDIETRHVDKTMLVNYTFVTGDLTAETKKRAHVKNSDHCSSVVFGLLTFCNHGHKNNAEVLVHEHGGTLYYILQAIRNIPKDTEICTTYGDNWFGDRK